MFGPSEITWKGKQIHHRSDEYSNLLSDFYILFREKFNIGKEHDIFFVTGSGTLANEIVIRSLRHKIVQVVQPQEHFADRLIRLAEYHNKLILNNVDDIKFMVQYETARSKLNINEFVIGASFSFVDSISSFPYYDFNKLASVWTTVLSKQIGCEPGASVIVVKRSAWEHFDLSFQRDRNSCLNLSSYLKYSYHAQSPHTPAMSVLVECVERLENFDLKEFREKINHRRTFLNTVIPIEKRIGVVPVYTIKNRTLEKSFVRKWDLYEGQFGPQLFLHSGTDEDYKQFVKEVKEIL